MKSRLLALFFALILVFCMAGCESVFKLGKEESSEPEQEDSVEERAKEFPVSAFDVTVESRPEIIVSLSPSVTDKLFEMGFADRLKGISDFCDSEDREKRTRCGSAQLPDLDAIESIKPHILLSDTQFSQSNLDALEAMGIKVALVTKAQDMKQLKDIYITIAQMLDGDITGRILGEKYFDQNLQKKLDELAAKAQDPPRNGVFIRSLDYNVATGDTVEGELLGVIGLNNIAQDYTEWNVPEEEANGAEGRAKFEAIDFIFCDKHDLTMKGDLEKSAFWKGLNAVRQDNYLYIDRDLFDRQSFKMLEELDRMQQYINGEIEGSKGEDAASAESEAPASQAPASQAPASQAPASQAPASQAPAPKPQQPAASQAPAPPPESSSESEDPPSDGGDVEPPDDGFDDGGIDGGDIGDGGDPDFEDEFIDEEPDDLIDPDELDQ